MAVFITVGSFSIELVAGKKQFLLYRISLMALDVIHNNALIMITLAKPEPAD